MIPDTCMDIIFRVDYASNKIDSGFCGINDKPFLSHENSQSQAFCAAIRFYPWGASVFSEESLKNTKNAYHDVEYHFAYLKRELEKVLFEINSVKNMLDSIFFAQ